MFSIEERARNEQENQKLQDHIQSVISKIKTLVDTDALNKNSSNLEKKNIFTLLQGYFSLKSVTSSAKNRDL